MHCNSGLNGEQSVPVGSLQTQGGGVVVVVVEVVVVVVVGGAVVGGEQRTRATSHSSCPSKAGWSHAQSPSQLSSSVSHSSLLVFQRILQPVPHGSGVVVVDVVDVVVTQHGGGVVVVVVGRTQSAGTTVHSSAGFEGGSQ